MELLKSEGCHVRVVRSNTPYRPAVVGQLPMLRALFRLLPYLFNLWRAMRHVDVVHVMANSGWSWHLYAAPAVWIASIRGVRCVVNYRGGEAGSFLARAGAIVRFTLSRAAALIVPSGYLQSIFAEHGIRADVVPNVVNVHQFATDAAKPPRKAATPHLVITRHLEAIYDVATALRAFAIIRGRIANARLSVAGDGPERRALEQLAEQLGIGSAVRFLGNVSADEIRRLYADADLMLNASRVDNMPNALLEAMACGVPIVTTRAGGIPFLVEHEQTALLVDVGDAEGMAAAALRVLSDSQLAERLRRQGIVTVEKRYQWSAVRERLLSFYRASSPVPGEAR